MGDTDYGRQSEGHAAVASGYLYKIAHNRSIFARWHRRYYVLYSDGLLYSYKSDRSKSSHRTIPVGRMCLRMKFGEDTSYQDCHYWPKKSLRNLCFSIINSDRSYHFFCESEKELNSWRHHLLATLGKLTSSSNWILAEKEEESGAAEKEGIADHVPHSLIQTEVEVQTVAETSLSKQEQLPYDAVGPATSLVGVEGRKEGEDNWSLDRSSEASKGSTSDESVTAHVSSQNLISVRSQLEQFEQSSEEEPSDTEEQLSTQGVEESGVHDHNRAIYEENTTAAPELHPTDAKSDQHLVRTEVGESEVLLTQFDTESESSDSEDEDDDESTMGYHTNRPLAHSTSVKNSSNAQPSKPPSGPEPSQPPSVEGTQEAAEDSPPSILHLKEHEQKEVTKAETPQVQVTELTIKVRSEEAIPPTDSDNSTSESSEPFAATPATKNQPPPTAGKGEHSAEALGTQAVEKPGEAHPPSPAEEDEEPGPLPVRQRLKRFSEPSKPVAPGNPAFSVMPLARHPQSYPQLPRLAEKGEGEAGREDRVAAAVGWVDKELRKLIAEIQRLGYENEAGQTEVKFGLLFEETANTFEALSGILRTAKKHKVVSYSGELLFQGVNDHTPITLLRTEVDDASLDKYTTANPRGMKRTDLNPNRKKTSGFGNPTQMTANCKCFVCGKRVYAMEFVAANEYTFHKSCFRCLQCSKPLSPGSYATISDKFYCTPHYERLYKAQGGYGAL